MRPSKRNKLRAAGWKVGDAAEFLGLSPEEAAFVELKISLAHSLRRERLARDLTQAELAELIRSSQSRVARMEAADAQVTIDLLIRALLALGLTRKALAKVIASAPKPAA